MTATSELEREKTERVQGDRRKKRRKIPRYSSFVFLGNFRSGNISMDYKMQSTNSTWNKDPEAYVLFFEQNSVTWAHEIYESKATSF